MNQEASIYNEVDLSTEIVSLIELGAEKHLNRTLSYSPFKLFYRLLKKKNPNLIPRIKQIVRNDIFNILLALNGFSPEIFINGDNFTTKGNQLRKTSYNIGIRILKNKLTVLTIFKVIKDSGLRVKIYNDVLEEVKMAAIKHLQSEIH